MLFFRIGEDDKVGVMLFCERDDFVVDDKNEMDFFPIEEDDKVEIEAKTKLNVYNIFPL